MNPLCLYFTFAAFSLCAAAHSPAQNLFYDFNNCDGGNALETASQGSSTLVELNRTTTNANTKEFWTAAGGGVTGKTDDFALDLASASAMGSDGRGGLAVVKGAEEVFAGARSFTICGWFKVAELLDRGARLAVLTDPVGDGFLLAGTQGHLTLQVKNQNEGGGWVEDALEFSETDTWVFFAVAFDGTGTTNNVAFYKGTAADGFSANSRQVRAEFTGFPMEKLTLTIGNSLGFERPLKGQMDNFAVYTSAKDESGALSEAAIREIFEKTVKEMKTGAAKK